MQYKGFETEPYGFVYSRILSNDSLSFVRLVDNAVFVGCFGCRRFVIVLTNGSYRIPSPGLILVNSRQIKITIGILYFSVTDSKPLEFGGGLNAGPSIQETPARARACGVHFFPFVDGGTGIDGVWIDSSRKTLVAFSQTLSLGVLEILALTVPPGHHGWIVVQHIALFVVWLAAARLFLCVCSFEK